MAQEIRYLPRSVLSFAGLGPLQEPLELRLLPVQGTPMDLTLPVKRMRALRLGSWILECPHDPEHNPVYLREMSAGPSWPLEVVFRRPVSLTIQYHQPGDGQLASAALERVVSLNFFPAPEARFEILLEEPAARNPDPNPNPQPGPTRNPDQNPNPGRTPQQDPNPENPHPDPASQEQIRTLQNQLRETKALCGKLHRMLNARLDQLFPALQQEQSRLEGNLQQNAQRILDLRAHLEDLNREAGARAQEASALEESIRQRNGEMEQARREEQIRVEQLEAERQTLETELRELKVRGEALNLDTDAARGEVEDLRERLQLDDETFRLLESNGLLKPGSFRECVDEGLKAAEKAEARLKRIIRAQQFFHRNLEHTILRGDGSVSSGEESGREESPEAVAGTQMPDPDLPPEGPAAPETDRPSDSDIF